VGPARLAWVKGDAGFSPESLAITIRQGAKALKEADWGITPVIAEALVKLPESRFKAFIPEQLAKEIVAMANFQGGLFFWVWKMMVQFPVLLDLMQKNG
jgi:hypothetical protein